MKTDLTILLYFLAMQYKCNNAHLFLHIGIPNTHLYVLFCVIYKKNSSNKMQMQYFLKGFLLKKKKK